MKLGVVGLPNVGKSTLFNAITLSLIHIFSRPPKSIFTVSPSFASPMSAATEVTRPFCTLTRRGLTPPSVSTLMQSLRTAPVS